MAIGDSYATALDLEEHLGREVPVNYVALLDGASRRVEGFCRRQFNNADTASARRFRPTTPTTLPVDDFHTTSGLIVTVNGTVWDADDYDLYPFDGIVDGVPGWPFWKLSAKRRTWPLSRDAVVTVTAKWGWAEVPQAVKQATLDCAEVALYGDAGNVNQLSIQDFSESYTSSGESDDDVPAELKGVVRYRRKRWGIA